MITLVVLAITADTAATLAAAMACAVALR